MDERIVESDQIDVPEIPELLEKVILFVLDEAKEKMEQGVDFVPFTALVVKENLFVENHPADSAERCFAGAKHTVEGARGADAYAFCYDGFLDTDEGALDVLIAEGGIPGEPDGIAVGYLYKTSNDKVVFEGDPVYIGSAPNFMAALKDSDGYHEDDIDDKYLADEEETTS